MDSDRIARQGEAHYASHNVGVKLTLDEVIEKGEWFIFIVMIKKGTKKKQIFDRAADICAALRLALFQPFEDDGVIKLSVSLKPLTENSLQKMLESPQFRRSAIHLPIALGYDVRGYMQFADLVKLTHVLAGGATNSGKTVFLRNAIVSLVVKQPVNRVNFVIIDTGASGLDVFEGLPHLSCPIVKGMNNAIDALTCLADELEKRVNLPVSELRRLPALICVMDEYASLIKNVDALGKDWLIGIISNLLRRGRHAKIHMILATQESFKQDMFINLNNFNARIAFRCSDFYNSKSILGEKGAEKLPGKGAMLFKSPDQINPLYLQGAFMSTKDIRQFVAQIASKPHDFSNKFVLAELSDTCIIVQRIIETKSLNGNPSKPDDRRELAKIILWLLARETVSVRQIKQSFCIGNRADDIMDELFNIGLVSGKDANKPRNVLPNRYEDLCDELISLLNHYGYDMEAIQNAFGNRCEQSDDTERGND